MTTVKEPIAEPVYSFALRRAIASRKNIQIITGDVTGLFPNILMRDEYVNLDQSLNHLLGERYMVLTLDMTGLSFLNNSDMVHVARNMPVPPQPKSKEGLLDQLAKAVEIPPTRGDAFLERMARAKYAPLESMNLLRDIFRYKAPDAKPIAVLVRHAGTLFPGRSAGELDQQDRQRLVYFLNWVSDKSFTDGNDMFLLMEESKADINQKITQLAHAEHIQIPLPNRAERLKFIQHTAKADELEMSFEEFADVAAGLPLVHLEDLVEVARGSQRKVTKKDVVEAVNRALQAMMGGIVTFKSPSHTVGDVIGYENVKEILADAFEDCNDVETAVPGILVSGPNGVGKTYIIEAMAHESGRVVIELSGLRNEAFGGTERFFEQFRLVVSTFGRIMIEVDEAHTAFGSVHSSQTHEVEKRLAGNLIKMMGDPTYHGKILWVLMTSRPDELDPDVKSRLSSIQVPIFDLEGVERQSYLVQLFKRKKIELTEQEQVYLPTEVEGYSNRDLGFMVKMYLARRKRNPELTILQFVKVWKAGNSIRRQREFQELLAAQHCTFPDLIPKRIAKNSADERDAKINDYKSGL